MNSRTTARGLVIRFFYDRDRSPFARPRAGEIANTGMPPTGTRLDEVHKP